MSRNQIDSALRTALEQCSAFDSEYWSFRGRSTREHSHAYFQYPAMMVPQMQGEIIQAIKDISPKTKWIHDPFVGSGTTLTESVLRGMNFSGNDINPLAILLCKTKAGPFVSGAMLEHSLKVLGRIKSDGSTRYEADFHGLNKWFTPDVIRELSRIKRAILGVPNKPARRFLWIAMAEAVRLTSNSRTSTFKLHIRSEKDIKNRRPSPVAVFDQALFRNIIKLQTQEEYLRKNKLLQNGKYKGIVRVNLMDSKKSSTRPSDMKYDLLITSPPYGDNATTVPYGQYSYLPLQWIELSDIDSKVDQGFIENTHRIDSLSLGGCRAPDEKANQDLCEKSPSFTQEMRRLSCYPKDRVRRVAAFCRDLDASVVKVLDRMRPGAFLTWTVGNRMVGGSPVPLDAILREMLEARSCKHITTLRRSISNKRMAHKNNVASTMRSESVLIMRKAHDNE